jgi:Predicted transcriptional regulator
MSPQSHTDAVEINYQLRRIGKTQAQIAQEIGVSNGVVSNVIHSRITAHAVASYIATLLGTHAEELWPERYVFKPRQRRSDLQGEVSHELNRD